MADKITIDMGDAPAKPTAFEALEKIGRFVVKMQEQDAKMQRIPLKGDIPSPANPPKGCKFHTRCPYAMEKCKTEVPVYKEYEEGHFAACHLVESEHTGDTNE